MPTRSGPKTGIPFFVYGKYKNETQTPKYQPKANVFLQLNVAHSLYLDTASTFIEISDVPI